MIDFVKHLSREQLLVVAAELPDDALRSALRTVTNGSAAAAPATAPGLAKTTPAAPPAGGKPSAEEKAKAKADAAAAKASEKAKAKASKAAAGGGDDPIANAITQLATVGFAVSDLAEVTGEESTAPKLRRAIAKAVEAGTLVKAGEKRFTRYGATKEIAEAAKARG